MHFKTFGMYKPKCTKHLSKFKQKAIYGVFFYLGNFTCFVTCNSGLSIMLLPLKASYRTCWHVKTALFIETCDLTQILLIFSLQLFSSLSEGNIQFILTLIKFTNQTEKHERTIRFSTMRAWDVFIQFLWHQTPAE